MSAQNPMQLLAVGQDKKALADNIVRSSLEGLLPEEEVENFCRTVAGAGELFLLEIEETAVGCMLLRPLPDKKEIWEIACVAVSPAWRRGGLGKFMVEKAESFAREKKVTHLLAKLHPALEAACAMFAVMEYASVKEGDPEGAFVVAKKL